MIKAILGKKIDQSQAFSADGKRLPVTQILAGPCVVVGLKTREKDGYDSVQLGLGTRRTITVTKPEMGHLKKAGLEKNPPRFLREVPIDIVESEESLKPGTSIKVAEFLKEGDLVSISGTSKGKGFQGGVKRHHFKGGPRTHGQSDRERSPGAIGSTTTPGRVYKGKRMAGRMGGTQITVKNLKVVSVDSDHNLLTISGLVPGGRNSILIIQKLSA